MVTVSPGFTENAIWVERCGGVFTSVPSVKISPSISPRGGQRELLDLPVFSGKLLRIIKWSLRGSGRRRLTGRGLWRVLRETNTGGREDRRSDK